MSVSLVRSPPAVTAEQRSEALLAAQNQSLEMIIRREPLADVLSHLARVVEIQADGAVISSILILDREGRLFTGAGPSLPDSYNAAIDGLVASADVGTCSVAAVTGQVVITPDIDACPKWADLKSLPLGLGLVAAWSQPIRARDGRILGTFGTYFRERRGPSNLERRLVETLAQTAALALEQKAAHEEMIQQQRLLDLAMEAAEMGAWRYSLSDNMCDFSPRAQRLYNVPEAAFLHDAEGVKRLLNPDDVPAMWAAVEKAVDPAGAGRYAVEYRVPVEGGWRWLSVWGVVEFEDEGETRRAVAIVGASRDVTERKRAEEHQRLLVNELNHRVKNTLATVQSLTAQSLRNAPDVQSARRLIDDRLQSLAGAHDILTRENWSGADLTAVVDRALGAFRTSPGDIEVQGPPVRLTPAQALAIAMAVHELATNAVKYGALSTPEGHVAVRWTLGTANTRRALSLSWVESGGPPVEAPSRRGFGTRLLEQGLVGELGGRTSLDYRPEGLSFEADIRL